MVWCSDHRVWMFVCNGYKASVNVIIVTYFAFVLWTTECWLRVWLTVVFWPDADVFLSRLTFWICLNDHLDFQLLIYIQCYWCVFSTPIQHLLEAIAQHQSSNFNIVINFNCSYCITVLLHLFMANNRLL